MLAPTRLTATATTHTTATAKHSRRRRSSRASAIPRRRSPLPSGPNPEAAGVPSAKGGTARSAPSPRRRRRRLGLLSSPLLFSNGSRKRPVSPLSLLFFLPVFLFSSRLLKFWPRPSVCSNLNCSIGKGDLFGGWRRELPRVARVTFTDRWGRGEVGPTRQREIVCLEGWEWFGLGEVMGLVGDRSVAGGLEERRDGEAAGLGVMRRGFFWWTRSSYARPNYSPASRGMQPFRQNSDCPSLVKFHVLFVFFTDFSPSRWYYFSVHELLGLFFYAVIHGKNPGVSVVVFSNFSPTIYIVLLENQTCNVSWV